MLKIKDNVVLVMLSLLLVPQKVYNSSKLVPQKVYHHNKLLIVQLLLEIKDVMVEIKLMSTNILHKMVLKLGMHIHTLDNKEPVISIQAKLLSKTTIIKLFHKIAQVNSRLLQLNNHFQLPLMLHHNNSNYTQAEFSMILLIVELNQIMVSQLLVMIPLPQLHIGLLKTVGVPLGV